MKKQIKKVLVANRGEIAIRIFRACAELGIKTVAIYSKEDSLNLFRTKADEAYLIGEGKSPLGAYLDIESIIKLAKKKNVDAIHPGYGFLSENAEFAKACEENDIIFIGPPSHVLNQMGDKINAKALAKRCNVPTIPGTAAPLVSAEEALKLAEEFGYPVILKASAGGGGRGMRKISEPSELAPAFGMVQSEALKAFGNGDIFMEKFLEEPKHIEVQILADEHGNIVHLHERDCSLQRRYQKVVEFTPAITLTDAQRNAIFDDALKIAHEVDYVNAGTIEFLVDQKSGQHYFIEMNPRIQVEHTVTEMVTGIDLVKSQILIAQGFPLDSDEVNIKSQDDIQVRGYSIQCRVTTEDPRNNFAPDTGKITTYRSGGGFGVRLDAGNVYTGAEITPYYDSLLVKITTLDRTFKGAIRKSLRAIGEIRILGVKTNMPFLTNILRHPMFSAGKCHTKFIDNTPELFDIKLEKDRGTKLMKFIGESIIKKGPDGCNKGVVDIPKIEFPQPEKPLVGLKQILDEKGPKGFADYVRDQKQLLITDTTMRDAHQSLLATRVRTRDMLNIADATSIGLNGAFSLEMWGGATFDVAYRFLHEDPWVRLEELRKRIPNIPFQMLLRGANAVGYTNYPDNLIKEFIRESAKAGIDIFRVFDSLNWVPGMAVALEEVASCNKVAEATICYSGDISDPKRDRYTLKYYVDLAKQLEKLGAHTLCIKDMSGLMKPYAAYKLVKTLKEEVGMPIHLHTHDTAGNQVAAILMAAEAGVDVVDLASATMSSLTSQPSLDSVVAALEGQERNTGLNLKYIQKISEYWGAVRPIYKEFESGLTSPVTDIYRYEIPGGQYSNLKPQVNSLGLGDRFDDVKEMFRSVNDMLGDIIKVTPSSKMVGDMAIFMVQNNLTPENIVEKGDHLNYPDSVVDYFKGMMGQPDCGFPKDLQKIVLKGQEPITCRPGELLDPIDFDAVKAHLIEMGIENPTMQDILGYGMYPKVMDDYIKHVDKFGDVSNLNSDVFFKGMDPGETTEVDIEDGKTLYIKYVGYGEPNDDGTRNLIFELNGVRREVAVKDTTIKTVSENITLANPDSKDEIGSSIPGAVSKILVKEGEAVEENQVVIVVEAMKMETSVVARKAGVVDKIHIKEGATVRAGELLMTLK